MHSLSIYIWVLIIRLRNWLQTNMKRERFSNRSLINFEKDLTKYKFKTEDIVNEFESADSRIINFI